MKRNGNLSDGSNDIIPSPRDEDEIIEDTLYGRNEATKVVFDGWTGTIIKRLVGVKANLAIKPIQYEDLPKRFENFEWRPQEKRFARKRDGSLCNRLGDLCTLSERSSYRIGEPLIVQVLEQKAIHVIRKEGGVLLIGVTIVGDDTGYCQLTCFNSTIESVYSKVKIGNHLILETGSAQPPVFTSNDNISLRSDKALKLEIKIREYDSRRLFVIVPPRPPKLDVEALPQKGLWLPSELWNETSSSFEYPKDLNQNAINVCGVISYVGQICRRRWSAGTKEGSSKDPKKKDSYGCFRWIQIVDAKVPKPLCLRILINSINFENQCNVVPGTAVVITNVVALSDSLDYFEPYLETSYFSRIFVNKEIAEQYLPHLPKELREIARKIVSPSNCSAILKRKDIFWGAGGTLFMKILQSVRFENHFNEESNSEESSVGFIPPTELARRETERLYVNGYIRKIFIMDRNAKNQIYMKYYWSLSPDLDENKHNDQTKQFDTVLPSSSKHWFPFVRELPLPAVEADKTAGIFTAYEKNLTVNREICSPLLLPAKYSETAGAKLKDFPMADGERCFIFHIFDPKYNTQYSCMWKMIPFDDMEKRVKDYIQKKSQPETQTQQTQEGAKSHSNGLNSGSEPATSSQANDIETTGKLTDSAGSLPPKKPSDYFIIDLHQIEDPPGDNLVINLVDFIVKN